MFLVLEFVFAFTLLLVLALVLALVVALVLAFVLDASFSFLALVLAVVAAGASFFGVLSLNENASSDADIGAGRFSPRGGMVCTLLMPRNGDVGE
jgi:hypothetical protein